MLARRVATVATRILPQFPAREFHVSARTCVRIGDSIPDVELVEDSPGNKVSILKELKGKGIIIGVPAAFSMPRFIRLTSRPQADSFS